MSAMVRKVVIWQVSYSVLWVCHKIKINSDHRTWDVVETNEWQYSIIRRRPKRYRCSSSRNKETTSHWGEWSNEFGNNFQYQHSLGGIVVFFLLPSIFSSPTAHQSLSLSPRLSLLFSSFFAFDGVRDATIPSVERVDDNLNKMYSNLISKMVFE